MNNTKNSNTVKKDKFYSRSFDSMLLTNSCNNMKKNIENENKLHQFMVTKKDKMDQNYDRNQHERLQQINYGFNYGAGRGFGNLDMANSMRFGDNSRADTKQFKEERETIQTFDYMFGFLDSNKHMEYQNSTNNMLRGGEITRKQNQLNVDSMRTFQNQNSNPNIEFKY